MKFPFRLRDKLLTLREHFYSHVPIEEKLNLLDDKLLLLLNQTVDIRELKPATGTLRLIQELEVQILRLLALYASQLGIKFWLTYGTLLGAVRHGGFVPWDDDLDIGLMQNDFDHFCSFLAHNLPEGLTFENWISSAGQDIGIARVIDQTTSTHVDLYAHNRFAGAINENGEMTQWEVDYQKEFAAIARETFVRRLASGYAERIQKWRTDHAKGDGNATGIATSMTFVSARPTYRRVYREADIFPLKEMLFEGCLFCVPNNSEVVLNEIYGDYLLFPNNAGHHLHFHANDSFSTIEIRRRIDEVNALVSKTSASGD